MSLLFRLIFRFFVELCTHLEYTTTAFISFKCFKLGYSSYDENEKFVECGQFFLYTFYSDVSMEAM